MQLSWTAKARPTGFSINLRDTQDTKKKIEKKRIEHSKINEIQLNVPIIQSLHSFTSRPAKQVDKFYFYLEIDKFYSSIVSFQKLRSKMKVFFGCNKYT